MASSTHNPVVLLKKVLSLSDPSPLLLCLDSITQTSDYLVREIIHSSKSCTECNVIHVSFETANQPDYANHFIDAASMSIANLISSLKTYLPSPTETVTEKFLVIIDSINYIPNIEITQFISTIASPHVTMVATFHKDMPEQISSKFDRYPSSLELLKFMASTVLVVEPVILNDVDEEELHREVSEMIIPRGLNNSTFLVSLINRRKSGRSVECDFRIDTVTHQYDILKTASEDKSTVQETPEALQNLTTFNLSTSSKQKAAKDQVELPYLEAQSFNVGGAIVYEYEKDDDYDEEDPYEDPF